MSDENKEHEIIISVGSRAIQFKHVACPNECSLMDPSKKIDGLPAVTVEVAHGDTRGALHLDPRYGSFENEHSFEINDGEIVEMSCPHCGVDLSEVTETCSLCSAPMFQLHLPRGGVVVGCRRKGCVSHRMKVVDLDEQFSRMFNNGIQDIYP